MTTSQKTVIAVTLIAAVGAGMFEARRAALLKTQVQLLQQQQGPLAAQIQQLAEELADATNKLASQASAAVTAAANNTELLKLRGEVARLRGEANQSNDSTQTAMNSWVNRVAQLKGRLQQDQGASIPELDFLEEEDWLAAVKDRQLGSDHGYRLALSTLRYSAENKFASLAQSALQDFLKANGNKFPTDITQLREFFDPPVAEAILQRWQIAPGKRFPTLELGIGSLRRKQPSTTCSIHELPLVRTGGAARIFYRR